MTIAVTPFEGLHANDSRNYPGKLTFTNTFCSVSNKRPLDDNHKPEMTIAVTAFEGLCGFRPLAEIVYFLNALKPLRELVGEEAASQFENAVKGAEDPEDSNVKQKNKDVLLGGLRPCRTSLRC